MEKINHQAQAKGDGDNRGTSGLKKKRGMGIRLTEGITATKSTKANPKGWNLEFSTVGRKGEKVPNKLGGTAKKSTCKKRRN